MSYSNIISSKKLLYDKRLDPELYDVANQKWVREVSPPRQVVPSDEEIHEAFSFGFFSILWWRGTYFIPNRQLFRK